MRAHVFVAIAVLTAAPAWGQTPTAPQKPAQTAPAATTEEPGSLFATTWRQLLIGGRFSSIDGDPARWQRYEDLRDGLLFTGFRYAGARNDGGQTYHVTADNVGWRDQRFTGEFEKTGLLRLNAFWDEIPQFYSVDTRTPFLSTGSVLTLDDNIQRSIQQGQANLNAYVPVAAQFDLRERRDIGFVSLTATPKANLDVFTTYRMQRHVGELPWGASFGFSNDVEIPAPYDSRINDFTIGAEWGNARNRLRVAYDGSWFTNHSETVTWDSPLRLDDNSSAGPGRGLMSLWPSNQAQTFSASGLTKLARRTQVTGFLSYGQWSNDTALPPFTINATLPQFVLPRATAEGEAHVFSTNFGVVSRPIENWRLSARFRSYDYNNLTPHGDIPQFINYDTSVKASTTGGPEAYAHRRVTFSADGTWTGLPAVAFTVGYTRNQNGYDVRIFESSGEDVLTLTADAVGLTWGSVRATAEFGSRTGSGLDESLLTQIGEQPAMRHYDLADRNRKRFTGLLDVTPSDPWVFTASVGFGNDDYNDSYFGLQKSAYRTFGLSADYQIENGLGAGASYTFERYTGFQTSRSASPGQETDPARDWTTDSAEDVNYFSIYVTPPRFGTRTEARVTYEFADARANYVYGLAPNSPLTPPVPLPEAFNKLQDLRIDVRHRLTRQLGATFAYRFEPSKIYDFALDPSVVDGIVQPSSLVLGYVYRPYTAHSFVVGLRYVW